MSRIVHPLISVVVPLYNHADFVADGLRSICDPSGLQMEVIVVDDGSTDESAEIAQKLLKELWIEHQFIHQENQGAHAAINRGIAQANGEWISIFNSDDRYTPGRLSRLFDHAQQTNSRFVFSGITHIDGVGNPLPDSAPHVHYYRYSLQGRNSYPTPNFELLRHNYAISTGNFFFHRSIFEKIGPFRDFKICHDWDFILRALLVTEISFLDETLYEYRVHLKNTIRSSVQELRYQEMDALLANYLKQAETASNPLAPCHKNWGVYWMKFVGSQIPFGYLPETSEAIKQILNHPVSDENIILDQTRQELLAKALENSQKKALRLEEELVNTKKYFESQINKSLPVLIQERLRARLMGLRSRLTEFFGGKRH